MSKKKEYDRKNTEPQYICYSCEEGCGDNSESPNIVNYQGDVLCMDCYESDYLSCGNCGDVMHCDEGHTTPCDSDYYCEDCRCDTFGYCEDCGEARWHDDMYGDEGYYCEDCYSGCDEETSEFVTNSPQIPNVSVEKSEHFNIMPINRLVGIEAECVFGDCETDEDGSPIALHDKPFGWREVYDGSINGNGRELISSPTNGDILHRRIKDLETWAREYDVYVNRSCGLHVHFDATDTDWRDLRAIGLVMYKVEQHLFKMLPPSRTNSNWCRKVDMGFKRLVECDNESDFVEAWYQDNSINREKYNDSRYHGLNIHARFYLGTIEFRYHSGTLNYEKISNWIYICNSIMETGIRLSRDKDWEHREFYEKVNEIPKQLVDNPSSVYKLYNNSPTHTLKEILDRMTMVDGKMIEYMLHRIKKFNPTDEVFIDNYGDIDMSKLREIPNVELNF
jgi:hypothetical protein